MTRFEFDVGTRVRWSINPSYTGTVVSFPAKSTERNIRWDDGKVIPVPMYELEELGDEDYFLPIIKDVEEITAALSNLYIRLRVIEDYISELKDRKALLEFAIGRSKDKSEEESGGEELLETNNEQKSR